MRNEQLKLLESDKNLSQLHKSWMEAPTSKKVALMVLIDKELDERPRLRKASARQRVLV